MNIDINELKSKIKKNAPVIITVSFAAVAAGTILYFRNSKAYEGGADLVLGMTKRTVDHMKETGNSTLFITELGDFTVTYTPSA